MSDIQFGTVNTKTDYGFIAAPYEIPMPKAQTSFVTIPGRDGSLDLSEGFGTIRYNDRTISVALYAVGEYAERVSSFINAVHGKRMNITFSKDPLWYYSGRVSVNGMEKKDGYCALSVQITAEPYKRKQTETTVSITGNGTVTLVNSRMPVIPTVINTETATLEYTTDGQSYRTPLAAGTHTVPTLVLTDGETKTVNIISEGTTTFTYREGAL